MVDIVYHLSSHTAYVGMLQCFSSVGRTKVCFCIYVSAKVMFSGSLNSILLGGQYKVKSQIRGWHEVTLKSRTEYKQRHKVVLTTFTTGPKYMK